MDIQFLLSDMKLDFIVIAVFAKQFHLDFALIITLVSLSSYFQNNDKHIKTKDNFGEQLFFVVFPFPLSDMELDFVSFLAFFHFLEFCVVC